MHNVDLTPAIISLVSCLLHYRKNFSQHCSRQTKWRAYLLIGFFLYVQFMESYFHFPCAIHPPFYLIICYLSQFSMVDVKSDVHNCTHMHTQTRPTCVNEFQEVSMVTYAHWSFYFCRYLTCLILSTMVYQILKSLLVHFQSFTPTLLLTIRLSVSMQRIYLQLSN